MLALAAFLRGHAPRAQPAGPAAQVGARLLALGAATAADALVALAASPLGLTRHEVAARRARYGHNEVAHRPPRRLVVRLALALATPLSLLLLALAAVNLATGETRGAVMIVLIVVLSTLLALVQEVRAGQAEDRLRALVRTHATVLRRATEAAAGASRDIPLSDLVPGDILHLCAGDIVPADVRLLAARDLFVDEAALTGESLPVEKHTDAAQAASALALPNVALMGTHVVSGTATAVVAATGDGTYFGDVARATLEARAPTAFDHGIRRFILMMLRVMAVMVPLVFAVNGITKGNWLEALLFAVAVAVGLAPEMLPMIVTINLAKGALAMSRRKVIVKRLDAIQNLGAMDVLCTDKTGTLTQDRVILLRHVDAHGAQSRRVLALAYLNSFHQTGLSNLLDLAVLDHARAHEHLRDGAGHAKVDELPFDFVRRRMSVIVAAPDGSHRLVAKGAVAEVLAVCTDVAEGEGTRPLDDATRAALAELAAAYARDGLRVVAVATRTLPGTQVHYGADDERDLTLAGFVAFLDPPKESAARAIATLRAHGVAVKVLTGDNEAVTRTVCREVGLDVPALMDGAAVDALDDTALASRVEATAVFVRLTPAQKARVIVALHRNGRVVGYLGDGINDGPALRAADVGLSVDTAVDVAKEAADIILMEKDLAVLDEGVCEGRRVFGNIVKYLRMAASSNFGNMASVLGASALFPFLPMAPVQVLANNLLYDVSQTAIATDNADAEYLARPRPWDIGNIGRYMLAMGPVSSLFDYVTFAMLVFVAGAGSDAPLFQSAWFVESLLSQTLVVHVIRTRHLPFAGNAPSAALMAATGLVCIAGLVLPYSPLAPALHLVPLPPSVLAMLVAIVLAYLATVQAVKGWLMRRFGLA